MQESGNAALVMASVLMSGLTTAIYYQYASVQRLSIENSVVKMSALGNDSNISAMALLRALTAFPAGNLDPADPNNRPMVFPDPYGLAADINQISLAEIRPAKGSATNLWSYQNGKLVLRGLDTRFQNGKLSEFFGSGTPTFKTSDADTLNTSIVSMKPLYENAVYPALITAIEVTAETQVTLVQGKNPRGERTLQTKARLSLAAPPTPTCQLTITNANASVPFDNGSPVTLNLSTFGVTYFAQVTIPGLGMVPATNIPLSARSVNNTGGVGLGSWNATAEATQGLAGFTDRGLMSITATVRGVDGTESNCTASAVVYNPVTCSLTANPNPVQLGNATTLTLVTSGPAINPSILGKAGKSRGWAAPSVGNHTVTGNVTAPGGTPATCSRVVRVTAPPPPPPPPPCRFTNPAYLEAQAGGLFGPSRGLPYSMITGGDGYSLFGMYWPRGVNMEHIQEWRYQFVIVGFYADNSCWVQLTLERMEGCFAPETQILMADGSERRVDLLSLGMEVINPITGQIRRIKKVVVGPEKKPLIEIGYDGKKVKVSDEHVFMTEFGLKQARELSAGESILNADGSFSPIEAWRMPPVTGEQKVWNLELEGPSTDPLDYMVLANGVVSGDLYLQTLRKKAMREEK